MKVLGQATADHTNAKKQAEQTGDKATACMEEVMIENILELTGYLLQHPEIGNYQ